MLVGLKSLAIGGGDITDDIAAAFGTRRAEAERIKCFYGSAMTSPRDNHDMIELAPIAGGQEGIESAAHHPRPAGRGDPPAARASHRADRGGAEGNWASPAPFGRQVVLTGGGAELKGIADYAQGVLGRAVRIGRPNMPGLPEAHSGPAFSTLAGLALFAASDEVDLRVGFAAPGQRRQGRRQLAAAADCGFSDSVLRKSGENMQVNVNFSLAPQNRFVQKHLARSASHIARA